MNTWNQKMSSSFTPYMTELSSEAMLQVIFDYAAKIGQERRIDKLLMLMANMGRDLICADRCSVWLVDYQHQILWTKVAHGVSEIRIPLDHGLVGYAVQSGERIFIDDAQKDPRFDSSVDQKTGYVTKQIIVMPIRNNDGIVIGAFQALNKLTQAAHFSNADFEKLELVAAYSGKAIETTMLNEEIEETQREIVFLMGEVGESRSKETGNHVKRVAEYSKLLAKFLNLGEEADLIGTASPMHDIGKVAIPDSILKKPGKLTPEEFEEMKTHTSIGYGIMCNSGRKIIQSAAIIANEHHEKWNGTGYPRGLSGEEIHLYGRITAVADVFDALGSDRCYKKAWELDRILDLFIEEKGQQFCPTVMDAFMEHLDDFIEIKNTYKDEIE